MNTMLIGLALIFLGMMSQQPASSPAGSKQLNYDMFKTQVQPIFLAKRPGHARCVACHSQGTPLRLEALSKGATTWNEEQSRKNFEVIKRVAFPGNMQSMLLIHPLEESAGGDFYHSGGKHWNSQSDPEWLILKAFVAGQTPK